MVRAVDDLVGQSVLLRPHGPEPTPELLAALTATRAAGVVLFGDNIVSPAQLHALVTALQGHAAALGLPPLLVAIDQEGGIVSRLPPPFTVVPSPMAQAATGDPASAATCARITGAQLRAFGVNVNFAPSLDVNVDPRNPVIGTRAFGDDPALVARFGREALRGYREAGVVAVAKHFPGHGDTTVDSHLGLPTVRHDRARLDRVELAPFRAAITAGVPAIMTAHVVCPALDDRPATLARAVLSDLLRGELGFEGVVVTDALDMRAIADRHGRAGAARLAKAAGADVVLPLGPLAEQVAVVDALRVAVRDGELSGDLFAGTAGRLDALRADYRLTHALPPFAPPDPAWEGVAVEIAGRGVTVTRGRSALPLAAETRLALIDCAQPRWTLVEEASARADLLRRLVGDAFPRASGVVVGPRPTPEELAEAVALAARSEAVLLVTRDAARHPHQARLGAALADLAAPMIHAAVRGPYDAPSVPGAAATLLTYGDPPVSLLGLVAILSGRIAPTGVPPVRLDAP
ncbi:MAG: GH3 [uncultured Thermomicrobiales bacterium]|uniref:GH3 n=1 Tax=uncultured Thermomicrobiales bacterium TaxID=1645740 RepID=A0A6J4UBN4_9BACT|nr:MAG: GH3 [uncultured Thermomicrobiales bacterium]